MERATKNTTLAVGGSVVLYQCDTGYRFTDDTSDTITCDGTNWSPIESACQGNSQFVNDLSNAVVTCEIKLFQNYFSLHRLPSEIIIIQRVEACPKLFQNYFTGLLQLVNVFQHVHCR